MKKYGTAGRKKIGRKKREALAWDQKRASAVGSTPKRLKDFMRTCGDPFASATQAS